MLQAVTVVWCALGMYMAHGAATTVNPGCGTVPADIVFLLDASGSVGSSNFQKQKDFVARFANSFDIGPNNVQIGVTTFSTTTHNQFNLNKFSSKAPLVAAIHGIPYQSGSTMTSDALTYVNGHSFTPAAGDRDHVANILVVMTDGQSNNRPATVAASDKLHQTNIKTFAIGIGSGINNGELGHIASDAKHVFTVSNFDALTTLQAELKKTACEIDGGWSKWGFWSPCSKTCGGGTHYQERTCSDPPPANGGAQCTGQHRQTGTCNTHACPTTPPPTTTTTARTTTTPTTPSPGCGVVPADIVFILDSSGSVGSANYQKMLSFVQTIVQGFTIGPNETEVSVVTFSDKPNLEFHLNKFHDKQSIITAISHVRYIAGGTNTADALKYARQTSFTTANGKRPNAAQIAIVITDGMSNSAGATASEAARLRSDGITVFSVGVGAGPKTTELNAMATDPDNQHVFVVTNFDALKQIKGTLAQKACEVKATSTPPPKNDTDCGAQADIVFLLDSSGSVGSTNFNKMKDFVTNVSNSFTIGPHDVQIGIDTFATAHKTEFTLGQHLQKTDLIAAINQIAYHSGSTHTGEAIQFLHNTSFTTAAGHRPNVPKIAIVVTDGNSNNAQLAAAQSDLARKDGIKMLAIGVGHGINDAELKAIASDPDSQYVFRADNFDALASMKGSLSSKACEASQPLNNTVTNCHAGSKADIIFNLDSSGSVGKANFDQMLEFVKGMVKNFDIGSNKIRVGLSTFSSRPYVMFNLDKYADKAALMAAIDHIPYKSGGTNTADALKEVYSTMFTASNGDRPGVPNIEIVITDGRSNNHPATVNEATATKNHGINVFSVGVGRGISKSELNDIASDPDSTHVMTVDDFSKLQQIQGAFASATCQVIPSSPQTNVPTGPPAHAVDPCQDKLANCATYQKGSCGGLYEQWARTQCARTCGYCSTALPTIPPECVDHLPTCRDYDAQVCNSFGPWAHDNCRKFCGFCQFNAKGVDGYYGKCYYNGKSYTQGQTWSDGCAYDCRCDDASKGKYSCYNKCPSYYNLPPQCTLTQKTGECCLQPVCNFNPNYQTTSGQSVGNLNGISTCNYHSHDYFQGQTWQDGCQYDCQCTDAGAGMYSCQSRCPVYKNLPPVCHLQQQPGKCCQEPVCDFNQQFGKFDGMGAISGKGVGVTPTAPPPCVDKATNCNLYQANMCTSAGYHDWAKENCALFCNFCSEFSQPLPSEKCIYKGVDYAQGQTWYDGCEFECMCENSKYGFYRCNKRCPDFVNLPLNCHSVKVQGSCCPKVQCDGGQGSFVGSSTVSGVVGSYPIPNLPAGTSGGTSGSGTGTSGSGGTSGGTGGTPITGPGGVPVPGGSTLTPGLSTGGAGLIPTRVDGCYVKGKLYQQGLRWTDGCEWTCICEDGTTGRYRCQPKCPDFTNLPSQCVSQEDPTDPCCKVPVCSAGANGQQVHIPVPSYKPGFSGYGTASLPQTIATGGYGPGPSSNGTSGAGKPASSFTGISPGHTVVGTNGGGCIYKGVVHQQGDSWDDGCDFRCQCLDAHQGQYRCNDRCPSNMNLPAQCTTISDPNDHCCKTFTCDFSQTITTPPPFYARTTPPTGGDYCAYKGAYYHQGEQWDDGCSFRCRCEDAKNHYHQCTDRCARFDNVPLGCSFVADPKDPRCCRMPQCSVTSSGTITGSQSQSVNPTGFVGSLTGYGKPPSTGNNPNISHTGYANACIYKGLIHQQGDTWHDGCEYDCECTDATKGMYRCTDRCPRFGQLSSNCRLTADPNDRCCQKAACTPVGPAQCTNKIAQCSSYGTYVCQDPYTEWAKENCNQYCHFCGSSVVTTTVTTACVDRLPNCKDYGSASCGGQDIGWAKFNCPVTCNYCNTGTGTGTGGTGTGTIGTGPSGTGGTGTGTIGTGPSGTGGTGTGTIGTGPGGTGGIGTGTIGTGPSGTGGTGTGTGTIGTGPSGTGGTGTGTIGTGPSGTGTGGTGSGSCSDTIPNCNAYTSVSCVDPYLGWAISHCAHYCNLCDQLTANGTQGGGFTGTGQGGVGSGTQGGGFTGTGTYPGGTGTGTGSGTQGGMSGSGFVTIFPNQGFTGQSGGCYYKGQLYNTGTNWQDACLYNCTCTDGVRGQYYCTQLCTQWNSLPAGCVLQKPPGECCSQPVCSGGTGTGSGTGGTGSGTGGTGSGTGGTGTGSQGSFTGTGSGTGSGSQGSITGSGTGSGTSGQFTGPSRGCYYKNQLYSQGQTFDDGCTYTCTCTDASRGYYTCKNKCVVWNLPSACHLNPPAQGKCCKTPNCPAGYALNYPPGYTEQ